MSLPSRGKFTLLPREGKKYPLRRGRGDENFPVFTPGCISLPSKRKFTLPSARAAREKNGPFTFRARSAPKKIALSFILRGRNEKPSLQDVEVGPTVLRVLASLGSDV